jgi:hypothetical protein
LIRAKFNWGSGLIFKAINFMRKIFATVLSLFISLMLSGCTPQPAANANAGKVGINAGMAVNDPPAILRVSEPGRDAAEPSVAADTRGNIYALYVEHKDTSADLYLRKFTGAFAAASSPLRINPDPGEVKAWRGDPPTISVSDDGKIYVGWNRTIKTADDSPANDLMLSVSADGGATFEAPIKVNDDTDPASHGMHAMTVLDGRVYFAWLDERYLKKEHSQTASKGGEMHHGEAEPNAELYFANSKDGGKSFSANKRIGQDICPCCKAQMTTGPDGHLFISWRQVLPGEFRHVAVVSTRDGGETFAEQVIVNDDKWHIMACPVSGAPLAIGRDSALATAWYTAGDAGSQGLYWAESKDGGKTFSPRALVSEGVILGTSILLFDKDLGYRVIWSTNGKIMAKKLSATQTDDKPLELADGELPSAAAAGGFIYLAYVKNENGKKAVWLQRSAN